MKKIAIATLFNVNFGCALQNYAVSKIFTDFGYKPETLIPRQEAIWHYSKKGAAKLFVFTKLPRVAVFFYKLISLVKSGKLKGYSFYKFKMKKPLNYRYVRKGKLPNAVKRYDYFVAGSDQVWNYNILLNDFTLLTFSPKEKNISISASVGADNFGDYPKDKLVAAFNNFEHISVRERRAKELIEGLTGRKDVELFVDPTMMLTQQDWKKVATGGGYKTA